MFKAVKSPRLLIKNTNSPIVIKDNFFLDLIKGFSVSKFQISEPSKVEKHLILFYYLEEQFVNKMKYQFFFL